MPTRPASPCHNPTCPNRRPCPDHPTPGRWEDSVPDPFYRSLQWRRARGRQLRKQPTCQTPGCYLRATDVDHIVSRRDGGADYALTNLQSLCHDHHQQKTSAAGHAARRRTA